MKTKKQLPKGESKKKSDAVKVLVGLNVNISMAQIHGNEIFSISGTTVGNSVMMYGLKQFERRYNISNPQLHRWIDKLPGKDRHRSCISAGKHYVNEEIIKMGKASGKKLKRTELLPERPKSGIKYIDASVPLQVASGLKQNEIVPITGATTDTGIAYYELEEFAKMHSIHVNTVRNYVRKLDAGKLVSPAERFRYRIKIDGKTYVTERMFFFNKKYRSKLNNVEYAHWLSESKWDVVGTVRFLNQVGQNRTKKIMDGLLKNMKKKFSDFPLNFFFTTEENPGKDGFHNHFVLGSRNDLPYEMVVNAINKYLEKFGGRYDAKSCLERFDNNGTFLEYLVKELAHNQEGWDFEFEG